VSFCVVSLGCVNCKKENECAHFVPFAGFSFCSFAPQERKKQFRKHQKGCCCSARAIWVAGIGVGDDDVIIILCFITTTALKV